MLKEFLQDAQVFLICDMKSVPCNKYRSGHVASIWSLDIRIMSVYFFI